MRSLLRLAAVALAVLAFVAAPVQAAPQFYGASGNGDAAPTVFYVDGDGSHWDVGPLDVYYDPAKGPLQKILMDVDPGVDMYSITEYFHVNRDPAWTDWHQEFVDPGWYWMSGTLIDESGGGMYDGVISDDGTGIDFYFDQPLPFCTNITIEKTFAWDASGGDMPPETVVINQWPTVPEPGSIVLLVSGLLVVLCYAWRKRK